MGFIGPDVLCSNKVKLIPDATLYHFGVLQSLFHHAWMRQVSGYMRDAGYNYSSGIVYNNFIWPDPTPRQRAEIETCAQAVLDARDNHPGKTLSILYDPDKMPTDLAAAHKALDVAVEAAYGVNYGGNEKLIVAHLFDLHAEKTK